MDPAIWMAWRGLAFSALALLTSHVSSLRSSPPWAIGSQHATLSPASCWHMWFLLCFPHLLSCDPTQPLCLLTSFLSLRFPLKTRLLWKVFPRAHTLHSPHHSTHHILWNCLICLHLTLSFLPELKEGQRGSGKEGQTVLFHSSLLYLDPS